MKKVLIISDYFAPDNEIAAIRLTKIAKYLCLSGYNIDVLKRGWSNRKEDVLLKKDLQYINEIYENNNTGIFNIIYRKLYIGNSQEKIVGYSRWKKIKDQMKKIKLLRNIKTNFFYFLCTLIDLNYCHTAISQKDIFFGNYTFILSSYGPMSSHFIGAYIKKRYKNITWVADFRDLMNDYLVPRIFRPHRAFYERKILKLANIITVASRGYFTLPSRKVHIINNGFDENDFSKEELPFTKTDKYIFCYAGDMYNGKRDIRIFFRILKEILDEQNINDENIEIRYLGKNFNIFFEQANNYLPNNTIKNFGFVSREQSLKIQNESNVLLLASWNEMNNQDMIPGKLYEYFFAKKPILCFINGNLANSVLKEMIFHSNAGCCYEEANSIEDYNIMKNYIKDQISNWQKGEENFSPKIEYIEQYNYKVLVKKLIGIIESKND